MNAGRIATAPTLRVPSFVGGRSVELSAERSSTVSDSDRERVIDELAREVGPVAMGIAMQMLGSRAAAEDALQDAFVQAYRGLPSFRGDASHRTWFLKILVNACTKHRRIWRRWVLGKGEDVAMTTTESEAHVDAHGDPGLRRRLDEAILTLTHRQRTAFVLRYSQDMSIDEIASVLDCAPGTVKATIHKAVQKLRRQLGDIGPLVDDERRKDEQ